MPLKKTISTLGPLLILFALLLTVSPALGAEKFCRDAPYFGVIDGNIRPAPTQITIDSDCTFLNFPESKPLTTNINFKLNIGTFFIIFDNVFLAGNMACANIDHKIWFSNSSYHSIDPKCQELFIPVETIDKQNPEGQTTAAVGVPFTYKLTLPSMSFTGGPSPNDLFNIRITDDLSAGGADLKYLSHRAFLNGTEVMLPLASGSTETNLIFQPITEIQHSDQIVIEIEVVLEDTARNVPGTQFTNTAKWWFKREIDGQEYEPLPGEWGHTTPMTIVQPNLVVTKAGPTSVINLGEWAEFTIDVRNSGTWAGDAWNVTVLDRLPSESSNRFNGGMCDLTPQVTGVTLAGRTLSATDYSYSYSGCELSLSLLESAGPIGPDEHLIVAYRTKVDADSVSGAVLTNVAGATQWSNDKDTGIGQTYTCPLTNGTEGNPNDCQDAHSLIVVLSGYFFEKSVTDPDTGQLVTRAMPGDRLRYTLRLRNISEELLGLTIRDDLGALNAFDIGSFSIVPPLPPGAVINGDPRTTGIIDIGNLSVPPSSAIEIRFDITLSSSLPEGFVVLNQAELFRGILKIADSDDPNINGPADPAVVGDEDPTRVEIYFPQPIPPIKESLQSTATIGEVVTYRITVPGTVSTRPLYNVVITDTLDENLQYIGYETISGPAVSSTGVAPNLSFSVAQIPIGQQTVIELRARVRNVWDAQQGIVIHNTASYTYANSLGGTPRPPMTSETATVTIVEPHITEITKSANPTAPTAGEIVRYSVTLTASGGSYASDVFDVTFIDNLGLGLVYAGNPAVTAGNTIGAPVINGDGIIQAQTLRWSLNNTDIDIAAGTSVTIAYDVRVLGNVLANQTLTNSVVAQWTSTDGPNDDERNGTGGIGELNDYITEAAEASVTTRDINATIVKERTNDTYGAGDADVRIGDIVEYRLTLSVPEGTLGDLRIEDTLPRGLKFEGTASINGNTGPAPFSAVAPFVHTAIPEATVTGDPTAVPSTVTWNLGFVTNQPTDGLSNDFVIVYRARVLNSVFAHTDLSIELNNAASMSYDTATGRVELQPVNATIVIKQPRLEVTKSSNPVSGSSIAAGNEVIYTVSILNSGEAPAYDVELQDIIPSGLRAGGITMVGTYLGSNPVANLAPVYNASSGLATWNFASGVYMIPAGHTLQVVYRVLADADLGAGLILTNQATVNWYYSFDDGAVPTLAGITGVRERYGPSNTSSTTLVTGSSPSKTLFSPATLHATIGQEVVYEIILPGTPSTSALYDVVITDPLDENLEYRSFTQSGPAVTDVSDSVTGNLRRFSVAQIPAGQQVVIRLTARVRNVSAAQQGVPVNNTVSYTYANSSGGATQPALTSGTLTVTIVEPNIAAINKSANLTTATVGDIVRYSVTLTASSGPAYSDVFDVTILDTLGLGLAYAGNPAVTAGNTIGAPVVTGDGITQPQTLLWSLNSGSADIDIAEGASVTISYDVRVLGNVLASQELRNSVIAQWTGIDGLSAFERTGADGIGGLNDYVTPAASASVHTPPPGVLSKARTQASAAIGEEFTYLITVPAIPVPTALQDVQIMDTLSASGVDLRFIGARVTAGGTWPLVNSGSDTDIVIENIANGGIDIPAGGQITVEITVQVLNTDRNMTRGAPFVNRAWYSYSNGVTRIGDDAATGADSNPMTLVHPSLTVTKDGPATMRVGTPGNFTVDVVNSGATDAWNVTVTDHLPNPVPGGMCASAPTIVSAVIYKADSTSVTLFPADDYAVGFSAEPTCQFTVTMVSASTVLAPSERLSLTYQVTLDEDNIHGTTLTNIAGATEWFSADAANSERHTYTGQLTDGTPNIADHQDAHAVLVEGAILVSQKSVIRLIADPSGTISELSGATAAPGDRLRYTITITNTSEVALSNFSLVDELEGLNASPMFQPGSIANVTPAGADYTINGSTLTVNNLSVGPTETLTVSFEVLLAPVITNGTIVRNQGQLTLGGVVFGRTGASVPGDQSPTETLIVSAPLFEVLKTSSVNGASAILMAGESLRYTLTIRNIGTEDAVAVRLRDYIPANTTYMANSTTLNGTAVADPSAGVSALQTGMLLNAPENPTPGYLRADAAPGATNVATVTFDVVVDPNVMDGLIIENQGFVSGSGQGSGPQPEQPSDDPNTPTLNDPTRNVVGNLPLLYAHKTVGLHQDALTPGIVDPGDVLRYTIVISNLGAIPATGVVFTDAVPANTTYVADSLRLNGAPVGAHGSVSPLIAGLPVHSADNPGAGILSAGGSAVITFEVQVNAGATPGTLIRNQGSVASTELPARLTDADGLPTNGLQPTVIVVGEVQLLSVVKEAAAVGGGAALAGGQLEYVIRITNIGSLPAWHVVVTDDLNPPLGDQVTYVDGSGTLNGATAGISYSAGRLTANYAAVYGNLPPAATAIVRFRVQIDAALPTGTTITNTGVVSWNDPAQSESASASIDVGGTPGSATLNGTAWHDLNLDRLCDTGETHLAGWSVELYRSNQLISTVLTDAAGVYRFSGLLPNPQGTEGFYELRFRAPDAGPNTASLGHADSPFTNGPQRITDISVASGGNLQNLNLPIWPNGAVYNSVVREPVAGATLQLLNATTGVALPGQCFDDPAQQNQITVLNGFYKFDLNFSAAACPAGGAYLIAVTAPATGYLAAPSQIIPPASDASTAPFSIPTCPGSTDDAVPATTEYCEATASIMVPPAAVAPRTAGTRYYLHLVLGNGHLPGHSQVFNNPIPIDPVLDGAVAIAKTTPLVNVTRGQLVPYTITLTNVFGVPLYDISIVDRFPAGFKYVAGSARLDGTAAEPRVNGLELVWDNLELQFNQRYTLKLLLVVGSGVSEGEYVNRALALNSALGGSVLGESTATVRVIPDPDFDCTDVIGKVFDDRNLNGVQDADEKGLPGVRVVTARGLISITDEHGRFHITCATVPEEDRGSNFILKLDERTLPTGYRLTTENPRVQRATRGKMLRFNFGTTIHRVVRIDIADGIFEPNTSQLRLQWTSKIRQLLDELRKAPSVLRLSYLADVEREGLVRDRLEALRKEIAGQWDRSEGGYRLDVETEIFWRRGAPLNQR